MYFNPQTEVMIVVDDSADLDGEIFNMEEFEGADWVHDLRRDAGRRARAATSCSQDFQTHYHPGDARSVSATANELEEEADDEEDDQEVGRESGRRGLSASRDGSYAKPNVSARIT